MTPVRRVATAALLVALLAFNLACPGPPPGPPPVETCEGAPADADVSALSGTAELTFGAQGSQMVVVEPAWTGAGAPACAIVTARLLDASGLEVAAQTIALATEATSDGRRAVSGLQLIVDDPPCEARVALTSYGRAAVLDVAGADDCTPDAGSDSGF
jgi:hypothetical protein